MRQNGEKAAAKAPFPTFAQPLQYALQLPAAKDFTHAVAASPLRSADTRLQTTIELCTAAIQIPAAKPDFDAKAEK